jgi:hypothetical protein
MLSLEWQGKQRHGHDVQFEFSKITEYIYLGTNLCCMTESHFQKLLDESIDIEIDMEKERQEPPPLVGVYLWLPVEDGQAPTMAQLRAGVSLIAEAVKMKKKIFVHCKYGHGRSPTLVAAYFMSLGMSATEAVEKGEKIPEIHLQALKEAEKLFKA